MRTKEIEGPILHRQPTDWCETRGEEWACDKGMRWMWNLHGATRIRFVACKPQRGALTFKLVGRRAFFRTREARWVQRYLYYPLTEFFLRAERNGLNAFYIEEL